MLLKSKQIWLTAQHMRRVYCWGNLYKPTCIPVLTGMHTRFLTWHEESLLLQRSLYQPLPRHELTKNNSQVIAGGPEAKVLMRYHLQLAPSRYVLVLPTANLPLVLPVLHMCAHTHPLVLFALPRLLPEANNLSSSDCPFQIQYLSGTKVAQAMFLKPEEAGQ